MIRILRREEYKRSNWKINDFKDFEDCIQDECAVAVDADCIVACNAKDFGKAKTKIYNPDEFVALF